MQPTTRTTQARQQLISNLLATARSHGKPLVLAAWLDTPIRVRCPVTDQAMYVAIRDLAADHVRAD